MRESQQVLEWQAEARKEGKAEGKAEGRAEAKAEAVLSTLERRTGSRIPPDLTKEVLGTTDLTTLDEWYGLAWSVTSVKEFRKRTKN